MRRRRLRRQSAFRSEVIVGAVAKSVSEWMDGQAANGTDCETDMASALLCCPPLPPRRHRYHTRTGVRPSISQAAAYESRKIEPNITVCRGAARAENLVMVASHGLAAAARAPARTVGATGRTAACFSSVISGPNLVLFPIVSHHECGTGRKEGQSYGQRMCNDSERASGRAKAAETIAG